MSKNKGEAKIQIGKNGLTDGALETIEKAFNTRESVKINMLKSATRNKRYVRSISEKIVDYLEGKYSVKIKGFTISLKKIGA